MNLKEIIREYKDLWKLLRKPSKEEIKRTIIVTLVLVFLIGSVGFLIQQVINFLLMSY